MTEQEDESIEQEESNRRQIVEKKKEQTQATQGAKGAGMQYEKY